MAGSLHDTPSILSALQGAYGAWINVDGFTVGEVKETFLGIRIFELAKTIPTLKHYIWSSLDYVFKVCHYLFSVARGDLITLHRKQITTLPTTVTIMMLRAVSLTG